MPRYRYEAVTPGGDIVRGELDCADRAAAIARIQAAGQLPIRAEMAGKPLLRGIAGFARARGLSRRERGALVTELASLLHAGLALDRALQIVLDATGDGQARRVVSALQAAVRGGASLSEALEDEPGSFSRFHVAMVRAAEASGRLDAGLARLAEHEERSRALRDTVLSALIYPAVLVLVTAGALLLILAFVVPQFTALFADAGQALPLSTQVVIGIAEALRGYWWLLAAGLAALVLLIRRELASGAGRYRLDSLALRLPLAGSLVRRIQMARLARTLGTLLASGVPLLAAVGIAKDLLSNQVLSDALELAAEALKGGRTLADPLISTGLFPALGLQMIKVGEETGRLDEMLARVAELYEREAAAATQRLLALLEPLLIVGLGLVIGAVIMSILLAIASVNDLPL